MLSFADYDEATIVSHINYCEQVKQLFLTSYISVSSQSIVTPINTAEQPEITNIKDSVDHIPIPAAVLDAVNSACEASGKYAALKAVQNMRLVYSYINALQASDSTYYNITIYRGSAADLLSQGVLQERMSSWISGGFCLALIDRLHSWVEGFTGPSHSDL